MQNSGADSGSAIRCEQLTKRYHGGALAVNNLDLQVNRGEIFGLLGPNGAGKTTTIGMLTTLVIPTGGKAWVAGIDVVAHPALVKQVIGVVSQYNNLDRALTVWENLYYHARYFGIGARESREAADRLLVEFRLKEHAKSDVGAISGGMARRLQLARTLLHSPSVIFLDEPTAGLDPQSRLVLWELMENLRRQGQTILLTTHDMKEADSLCDRLAIIDHGRLLAVDTPKKLKESVAADTVITVSASGDIDKLAAVLREKINGVSDVHRLKSALQLMVKGTQGVLPKVVAAAEQGGFIINDIAIAEPTLETVFIKLTGKELRE